MPDEASYGHFRALNVLTGKFETALSSAVTLYGKQDTETLLPTTGYAFEFLYQACGIYTFQLYSCIPFIALTKFLTSL